MSCCWRNTIYCTADFLIVSVFGAERDGKEKFRVDIAE